LILEVATHAVEIDAVWPLIVSSKSVMNGRQQPRVLDLVLNDFPRSVRRALETSAALEAGNKRRRVLTVRHHVPDDIRCCANTHRCIHATLAFVGIERRTHDDLAVRQSPLQDRIRKPG
jgi:hypothetical protein